MHVMAIYRKGEGSWSRGIAAATFFAVALFGARRVSEVLVETAWGRGVLWASPVGELTGARLAAGLVLSACVAGIWILLNHVRSVDFLIDTETELRKVSWPVDPSQPRFADRYRELIQSSFIVITSVLVMGVALFVYDLALGSGIRLILGGGK